MAGRENIHFEMESKQGTYAGIYEDIGGTERAASTQEVTMSFEKQGAVKKRQASTDPVHSAQPDAVMVQRLLYAIAAVVAVSFLTSAATLILALTMMTSRNASTASADCFAVKGKRNNEYL